MVSFLQGWTQGENIFPSLYSLRSATERTSRHGGSVAIILYQPHKFALRSNIGTSDITETGKWALLDHTECVKHYLVVHRECNLKLVQGMRLSRRNHAFYVLLWLWFFACLLACVFYACLLVRYMNTSSASL